MKPITKCIIVTTLIFQITSASTNGTPTVKCIHIRTYVLGVIMKSNEAIGLLSVHNTITVSLDNLVFSH